MANDYGRLSAADRARLKRARKRAGVKAPEPPVRGENAKDKARVPVQTKAREDFEHLQRGHISPATFAKRIAGLDEGEKKDLGRYSKVRSEQVQDKAFGKLKRDTGHLLDEAVAAGTGVKPSDAIWAVRNPVDRVTNRTHRGQHQIAEGPFKGGWQADDEGMAAFPGFGMGRLGGRAAKKAAEVVEEAVSPEAQRVLDAMPGAKKLRKQQEVGYTAARKEKIAAASDAMQAGGREGLHGALNALRGELPKLKSDALGDLGEDEVKGLLNHIRDAGDLQEFDKIHTMSALVKWVDEGRTPTEGEFELFHKVFDPPMVERVFGSKSKWKIAGDLSAEIMGVPRALKASLDLSAPFRQGLVLGARHPVMFAKEFPTMVKAWKSETVYEDVLKEIQSRPSFETMRKNGLHFTDLGHKLADREEVFVSQLAERIPVLGPQGVRRSSRAYTAFLNKFRADAFDNYVAMAENNGEKLSKADLRGIANWVNTATGRGSWNKIEGAMVPLTTLLFSPRLLLSRLQLLNPAYYTPAGPLKSEFARKQARAGMRNLMGGVLMTLGMAKMAGAEVSADPRNTDFGKIRFGNTRIDILGGLQQPFVAAYRIAKGESVSSSTGVMQDADRGVIGRNFLGNKLAPVPGMIRMKANNENFAGDPFQWRKEIPRSLLPIGVENAYEGFKDSPEAGIANVGLGSVGFGVSTYDGDPKKTAEAKRKAALAKRGPKHVRDHEDRMATLKAEAKKRGVEPPKAAIVASRRIRDLDLQLKRAKAKAGTITYKDRAQITKTMFLKAFPYRKAVVNQRFAEAGEDMDRWEKLYRLMRSDLRAPYTDLFPSE